MYSLICVHIGDTIENGGLTDIDDLLFIPSIVIPPLFVRGKDRSGGYGIRDYLTNHLI